MNLQLREYAMAGLLATVAAVSTLSAHSAAAEDYTIRYAMQKVPEDFVYQAKDWGARFGLKVTTNVSPSAVRSMEALLAGQADIADSGSGPVLSAMSRAPDKFLIIAATHSGGQRHELMVAPTAAYKSVADLKNKRIAIATGSGAYIIFEQYIAKQGWANNQFQLVNMKPGDMGSALASAQIDAALTWEPTPSILVTKGVVKVIQSFAEVSTDPALLVTTREFAQKHPEALVRVLASMVDMYGLIKSDPQKAGELAAKVEEDSGAQVPAAAFKRSFENMTFDMHVTKMDIAALTSVGEFMVKGKRIASVPDFPKLVDTSYLKRAFKLAKEKK
jgi:aliphatic sulfonates family ABC transporter substrate-binding protein